jgi:hypothetical protein
VASSIGDTNVDFAESAKEFKEIVYLADVAHMIFMHQLFLEGGSIGEPQNSMK